MNTLLRIAFASALVASFEPIHGESPTVANATKDAPFVNSLGMKFVPVPDTKILMCIHETRRADFAPFTKESMGVDQMWKDWKIKNVNADRGDEYPVANVGWATAKQFCRWLTQKEQGSKHVFTYRLPTDLEWSCAVGIAKLENPTATFESKNTGIPDIFPWGNEWPPKTPVGNYADVKTTKIGFKRTIEGYDDGYVLTSPVMSYPPNQLGIYDLGGNVWEWCEDWADDSKKFRVLRGGSWGMDRKSAIQSCARIGVAPVGLLVNGQFGFRVVVTTEP